MNWDRISVLKGQLRPEITEFGYGSIIDFLFEKLVGSLTNWVCFRIRPISWSHAYDIPLASYCRWQLSSRHCKHKQNWQEIVHACLIIFEYLTAKTMLRLVVFEAWFAPAISSPQECEICTKYCFHRLSFESRFKRKYQVMLPDSSLRSRTTRAAAACSRASIAATAWTVWTGPMWWVSTIVSSRFDEMCV